MTKKAKARSEESDASNPGVICFDENHLPAVKRPKTPRPFTKLIGWLGTAIIAANLAMCAIVDARMQERGEELQKQSEAMVLKALKEKEAVVSKEQDRFNEATNSDPSMSFETWKYVQGRLNRRLGEADKIFWAKHAVAMQILDQKPTALFVGNLFSVWGLLFTPIALGVLICMGVNPRRYVSGLPGSAYRFRAEHRKTLADLRARCDAYDERVHAFLDGQAAFKDEELKEAHRAALKQLRQDHADLLREICRYLEGLVGAVALDKRRLTFIDDCSALADIRNALKRKDVSTEDNDLRVDNAEALLAARLTEQAGEIGMPLRFLKLKKALPPIVTDTAST